MALHTAQEVSRMLAASCVWYLGHSVAKVALGGRPSVQYLGLGIPCAAAAGALEQCKEHLARDADTRAAVLSSLVLPTRIGRLAGFQDVLTGLHTPELQFSECTPAF